MPTTAARRQDAWRATSAPCRRAAKSSPKAAPQRVVPELMPASLQTCVEPCPTQRLMRRSRPPQLTITSPKAGLQRIGSLSVLHASSCDDRAGEPLSCTGFEPSPLNPREDDVLLVLEAPSSPLSPVQGKLRPRHSKRSKTLYEPSLLSQDACSEKSEGSERKNSKLRPLRRKERSKTWASPTITATTPSSVSLVSMEDTTLRSPHSTGGSPHVSEGSGGCGIRSRTCFERRTCFQSMDWRRGQKIGSGSYGCVFKAQNKETGQIFAVKEAVLSDKDGEDNRFRDRLEDELIICKELRHPHIVSCLGHDYEAGHLYIYLEYVPGGSLASMITEFGPVVGRPMRTAAQGLLEGLDYLHTCDPPVVHRDIKAANVLVDLNFCVKLADFGCSKRASITTSFTTLGSIPWMAPEVIQQQDGYGRKADVWSLGCTFIEMATAEKPWGNKTFDNVMFALKHIGLSNNVPPLPEALCESGRDLISLCVQRRAEDRPWAADLLLHPFLEEE
mmetsp:Transcript_46205/g.143157  ORF Transcript_46205/g.143157 Transcript_46205/m.143157 type:complete len:503 (+) Transcript_46205:25-1533(+)